MEAVDELKFFAGMALAGMLAHSRGYHPREKDKDLHWHKAIAKEAFEIADAMFDEARSVIYAADQGGE